MLSRYVAAIAALSLSFTTATAQLVSFGPLAPEHGFPTSYTDSQGTSLAPCLSNNGLCVLAAAVELLNPNQPFPQNYGGTFPDEFFYWGGESTMTVNGGGTALLVMALNGSFAGGAVLAGDQTTFGRIRLRIDNLQVGSTYHITTPYGTFDLVPTVAGRRSINFTQDIGLIAGDFQTALNGGIGPFLRWDSGLPIIDVDGNRYLGDPNVEHTVTGSPTGNNIFRIEGPNAGGPGIDSVQTNLFAITGMLVTVPAPVAEFAANPTSGTAPLNVAFTNQSTGSISTFAWNFGDGGTSSVASPSHTYSAAGTFTVSLTVTGPGGSNTRTRANLITVNAPAGAPVANFSASPRSGAAPLNVVFSNTSTGSINTFAWSFGDGGTSNVASPSHVYTTPGTYNVSLTVTGPGGTNTRTQAGFITVGQPANLRIQSITPGTAGARNTVTVTGCTPNAQIFVLWSTAAGSTPIQLNACTVISDLASPQILTQGRTHNSSTLEKTFRANRALTGQTLRLQAVDSGNCAKSPVLVETF